MLPKDIMFENNYSYLMNEIKKMNEVIFWQENFKRTLLIQMKKFSRMKNSIQKISPYEFPAAKLNSNYFSNERIAIYTSIFGKYDEINEPLVIPDNCDFFIFTDMDIEAHTNWKKIKVDLSYYGLEKKNDIEKNRFFKMLPHKVFPEYKYSIYVDGNIKIMTDLTEFIHNMNGYGLKMHGHFRQNCIYKEIKKCKKMNKDTDENLNRHLEHLVKVGMPKNYGLLEAPIIVREHQNTTCIELMEEWWDEFNQYSKRDQISLPYVMWKNGVSIEEVAVLGNDIYSNFAFRKMSHNK